MTDIYFARAAGESHKEMSSFAYNLLIDKLSQRLSLPQSDIVINKDERGKPFVEGREDVFVSISHSKGAVMVGISDKPIGVDIEMLKTRRKTVEKRVFTDREISLIDSSTDENKAFFVLWTLKESYLKAIGTGFADNAESICFYSLDEPILSDSEDYYFSIGELENFIFAVCEKK